MSTMATLATLLFPDTLQDTASVAKKGHEIREQLKEGEFSAKIVKS